jgi:pimeloyl-ACP methyl ester carboxylesterase
MDAYLQHSVLSDGVSIRYGVSGRGDRDVLLVHGSGAHHVWWHAVAPRLEERWRVITLDLSGHGESGHRPVYKPSHWVNDILMVLNAVGSERPVYVGHSMGGRVGISFAARYPSRLAGLVIFDSSIHPEHRYREFSEDVPRETRIYSSRSEAISRFKLLPAQPAPAQAILDPVADYSLKKVKGGWTWKHDPRSLRRFNDAVLDAEARTVASPMVFVQGSESVIVDDELADYAVAVVGGPAESVEVENAHHHLILDQPDRCADIIHSAAAQFHPAITPI